MLAVPYNRQRYLQDKIYTSVGDILIAVNPFKMLPLYTPMVMAEYRGNDYRCVCASTFHCGSWRA